MLRSNFNTFWDFYNGASVCAGSLKGHMKGCACGWLSFLMDFFCPNSDFFIKNLKSSGF